MKKIALIIGAGPAGLTAALELLRRSDITPIVLEADTQVGGISRTVNHLGNRIDIGGHRFFSKSDWVMNWWKEILPVQTDSAGLVRISYQNKSREVDVAPMVGADPDRAMLLRGRLSRIYYLRRFFDYPIKLSATTLGNLGPVRVLKIGVSYAWARLFPRKIERSLEDFLVNRFGRQLYLTFFKDYTEKVWGVPCHEISAEWGAQRIKGLSVSSALKHALRKLLGLEQKTVNTSLIERFLYPKFGPGQMWEEVANQVRDKGGKIHFEHLVRSLILDNGRVTGVRALDVSTGREIEFACDYVFSTMPVRDLVRGMNDVPAEVREVAEALPYRDFITVGLLAKKMRANPQSRSVNANNMPPDNWIYIQENDVKVGRLQIFNNWSPGMVADPSKVWMGLEYFCNEGDTLWAMSDDELKVLGKREMAKIGLLNEQDVEDAVVIRMPKAYPAYFGSYARFEVVREYLDCIQNLFPVGRNGMHRYNNQDHSMLTAKLAVDNILAGVTNKANIWAVNVDDDYHEEKCEKWAQDTGIKQGHLAEAS
ncbi:NAD(P)/FAD-dependent oxidoreductase [Thiobacillus sp.]|uniref:NAD(P)/FAD-dependent oxidoreductase n=1 Tax=Thiobacillus sp. TaxID=924 RepID=UPI00286DE7EA|nr:NAD(P)/FAD-dependent oxidoreductase [Thiobacillus sp.]